MKRIIILTLTAIMMVGAVSSCSSKKNVTTSQSLNEEEIEVRKSKSQTLAEEKPILRDFGEGTNFNQSFAKQFAETQARASFSRKMQSLIRGAAQEAVTGVTSAHSDGVNASIGTDAGFTSDAFVQQISENVLSSVVVINTDTFKKKDGQYHVYVCVEYMGDVAKLASQMTNQAKKQVEQQVSDEEKQKIQFDQEKFRKSIEDQFKKLH